MPLTGRLPRHVSAPAEYHTLMKCRDRGTTGPDEQARHQSVNETSEACQQHTGAKTCRDSHMLQIAFADRIWMFQEEFSDHRRLVQWVIMSVNYTRGSADFFPNFCHFCYFVRNYPTNWQFTGKN